jgi:hypothetical protein
MLMIQEYVNYEVDDDPAYMFYSALLKGLRDCRWLEIGMIHQAHHPSTILAMSWRSRRVGEETFFLFQMISR